MRHPGDSLSQLARSFPEYVRNIDDFEFKKIVRHHKVAEVWLAVDQKTQKLVAVKQLFSKYISERKILMFTREVTAFANCDNEFVDAFVGFTISDPFAVILEYKSRGSLTKYINNVLKSGDCDPTILSQIIYGVASGMAHFHAMGFVHRDLKPSNIMLDENFYPTITDAWNCRRITHGEMTRKIGSLNIIAPEMLFTHNYDNKVDVYSFGLLVYVICEKAYPFGGYSDEDILEAVRNGQRPAFEESSDKMRDLIQKCWNENPALRPSFVEICEQIESGLWVFEGTDMNYLEKFIQDAKLEEKRRRKRPQRREVCIDVGSLPIVSSESSIPISKSGSFDRMDIDVDTPEFGKMLQDAKENLLLNQFSEFYEAMHPYLETCFPVVSRKICETIIALVNRNVHFLEPVCQNGFFEVPLLRTPDFRDQAFELITDLFLHKPDLVLPYLRPLITTLIHAKPSDMLALICQYCKEIEKRRKPIHVIDMLIAQSELYVCEECGVHFVRLIYLLTTTFPPFRELRMQEVRNCMPGFLKSKRLSIIRETYKFLTHLYDNEFSLPFDVLTAHIQTELLRNYVVSLLLRIPKLPISPKFAAILITLANCSHSIDLIIFKYADQSDVTAMHVARNRQWMRTGLVDIDHTITLLLILLKYSEVVRYLSTIPDTAGILSRILSRMDERSLEIVWQCILKLGPSTQLMHLWTRSRVIENFLRVGGMLNTPSSLKLCLDLIKAFAPHGFSIAYFIFFETMRNLLTNPSPMTNDVLDVLMLLIKHQQVVRPFKQSGIAAALESLDDDRAKAITNALNK